MASRAPIVTPPTLITNEVQSITVDATGGTYTITFKKDQASSQTTAPIAFNATAAQVQAALEALSDVAVGTIQVTGGPGAGGGGVPYVFTFVDNPDNPLVNDLGGRHIILLSTDAVLLTGGASTAVVTRTTAGQSLAGPISAGDNDPVLLFARPSSDEDRTFFVHNNSDTKDALVSWDGGKAWWPLFRDARSASSLILDRHTIRGDVYAKNKDPGQNFDEIYVTWA